ncbi:unnamed protein product [Amoebophrya sp. A25]|nr:unnamed protein product [Amoebophrya sp. A25]|eukprot:GSA25T00003595001.1
MYFLTSARELQCCHEIPTYNRATKSTTIQLAFSLLKRT